MSAPEVQLRRLLAVLVRGASYTIKGRRFNVESRTLETVRLRFDHEEADALHRALDRASSDAAFYQAAEKRIREQCAEQLAHVNAVASDLREQLAHAQIETRALRAERDSFADGQRAALARATRAEEACRRAGVEIGK